MRFKKVSSTAANVQANRTGHSAGLTRLLELIAPETNGGFSRAGIEVARIEAGLKTMAAQIKAPEAMLNASLGRATGLLIPELTFWSAVRGPPDGALAGRPEDAGTVRHAERGISRSCRRCQSR